MGKRPSLADYAKTHPLNHSGTKAWITTIPEFEEVCAAYKAGVPPTTIYRWLADPDEGCGYDEATENRVVGWLKTHGPKIAR